MNVPRRSSDRIKLEQADGESGKDDVDSGGEDSNQSEQHENNLDEGCGTEDEETLNISDEENCERENWNGEIRQVENFTEMDNLEYDVETANVNENRVILENNYLDELDYRLQAYVNFVVSEGISNKCIERMDGLMTVLYGSEPIFSKSDVLNVISEMRKSVVMETKYYCNRCGGKKTGKRVNCSKCKFSAKNLLETVTFVKCDVNWQLKQFLKTHGFEIVLAHQKIHNSLEQFRPQDIRRYPKYRSLMETVEQFERKQLNLMCTYSSDGALFKRISRREATPVYLNIEGVDIETKKAGNAISLLALSFSDGGVKKSLIQEIVEKTFGPLENLKIEVDLLGNKYSFKVRVMSVLCDMKEQAALTSLPNWNQIQGCSKCLTVGRKKSNGKVTYDNYYQSRLRTDDEMLLSSENQEHGYTCETVPEIYRYVVPTSVDVDPFHIRGMGVSKQIVSEFLKVDKWRSCRMNDIERDMLKQSIDNIVPFTSETVKTQSFKKLSKLTGREYDKLALNLCALIGLVGPYQCVDWNALYLGWHFSLEFLGSVLGVPLSIRDLLNSCYEMHVFLEKDSITMKWHSFYRHLLDHETQYGALHTTEIYEREHKTMMTTLHHQSSNCENIVVSRYCARKIMMECLNFKLPGLTPSIRENVEKSMRRSDSFIFDIFKPSNTLSKEELIREHQALLDHFNLPVDVKFHKRAYATSVIGSYAISADAYWKNERSASSFVMFTDSISGAFKFGQIQLLFSHTSSTYLLCTEFELEPLLLTVQNWKNSNMSLIARKVVDACLAFPSTIGKIVGEKYSIVSLSSVICPSIIISFAGHRFIKMSS